MMDSSSRMRSVDDKVDLSSSDIHRHQLEDSAAMEGNRMWKQSPRADFYKDVLFENVCMPSSPSLPTTGTAGAAASARGKTSPGVLPFGNASKDTITQNSEDKSAAASQSGNITHGKCPERDRRSAEESSGWNRSSSAGLSGKEKDRSAVAAAGSECSTGNVLLAAVGGPTSSDVLNYDAEISKRPTAALTDRPNALGIERNIANVNSANTNNKNRILSNARTNAKCRNNIDAKAVGSYCQQMPLASPKNSGPCGRVLLVTDLDATMDDPPTPGTLSIDDAVGQQRSAVASGDALWQFSGRRLSNFCQTLMTECNTFATESVNQSKDSVFESEAGALEDDSGLLLISSSLENSDLEDRQRSPLNAELKRNGSLSEFLDGCTITSSDSKTKTKSIPAIDSGQLPAADVNASATFPVSVSLKSLLSSPVRRIDGRQTKTSQSTQDSGGSTTQMTEHRKLNTGTGRTELNRTMQHSETLTGQLEDDAAGGRSAGGRRGRTMERGKLHESSLLKDFIKPEQKKFSLAPSHDLTLDTELAIWEPSDIVPDRHKSAPPADLSMKEAKSEDLLMRSRQASVSPMRQRTSGPRWIRGSKSVELLTSRNASPSSARIRRRALSKEWQVVTLTTREEITTTIRPKATSDDQIRSHQEQFEVSRFSFVSQSDKAIKNIGVERKVRDTDVDQLVTKNEAFADANQELQILDVVQKIEDKFNDSSKLTAKNSLHKETEKSLLKSLSWEKYSSKHTENRKLEHDVDTDKLLTTSDTQMLAPKLNSDFSSTYGVSTLNVCDDGDGNATGILSPALLSSGITDNSETSASLSVSDSDADQNKVWDEISEALSDIMKEVQMADDANPKRKDIFTGKGIEGSSCFSCSRESELEKGDDSVSGYRTRTLQVAETRREVKRLDDFEIDDSHDSNATSCIEMDELVQALLDFANQNDGIDGQKRTPKIISTETSLRKVKDKEFMTLDGNANVSSYKEHLYEASPSRRQNPSYHSFGEWPPSEDPVVKNEQTFSSTGRPNSDDKTPFSNFSYLEVGDNTAQYNELSLRNADDDSVLEVIEDSDIFNTDELLPPPASHSRPLAMRPSDKQCRDNSEKNASGKPSDNSCRQRFVSKQEESPEVTSRRRQTDNNEVYLEKAFLESLFSSLGTIIFLLLAALIFHVFSRIVEHEL